MNTTPTNPRDDRTRPIAIVGMAATFPGVDSVDDLWRLLQEGTNTVSEVPLERFDITEPAEDATDLGSESRKFYGNFLAQPDAFDNSFFHVSPREAQSMDPQQRILLQVAYHALESAGYTSDAARSWNGETFGTYIGAATHDYEQNLRDRIGVYYSTGTLQSFLGGKIAFAFRFSGPSLVLDTACSSSIVAIHQACRALQSGDCNAALAGGVNVITSPDMHLGLSRAHFLSDTGQCRPWDACADGYCRSEGCGLFILKRLDDALEENDRILGVIRGIEVNQSGRAGSITHPHGPTQVALFEKVVASSGIHPHDISVVECHGAGTQAGDPVELEAIRKVFAVGRASDNPLHIMSVKTNIGHAEAASGAASLAKLLLMFREKTIPRHPSFVELNPRIPDLGVDNVLIDTVNVPWSPEGNRLVLLNNFGASGSNAALILEEYVAPARSDAASLHTGVVVGIACKSLAAAEKMRAACVAQLKATHKDATTLSDFAYSATARRQLYPFRISAAGSSKDEIIRAFGRALVTEARPADKVVFVLSGQGSLYMGMGAELYRELPVVSKVVDECDLKLTNWGFDTILDVFRTSPSAQPRHDRPSLQALHTALFVLEYALAQLWISWGVRPMALIGLSFGEFAALTIADVLTLDDALKLVAIRARLISEKCLPNVSDMTSVRASVEELAPLLIGSPGLEICCFIDPSHQTIGGPLDQLQEFEQACALRGIHCTRLDMTFAYHSTIMDPVLDGLRTFGSEVRRAAPKIPIFSNVAGAMILPGDQSVYSSDYFARHCREPARFHSGFVDFQSRFDVSTIAAFVEIGPLPSMLSFFRSLQQDGMPMLLPSLRKNSPAFDVLCGTLAQLYRTSLPVQWRKVFADLAPEARLVDLPPYPFADTRFWVPYKCSSPASAATRSCRRELGVSPSHSTTAVSALGISLDGLSDLIQGHQVLGFPLCPASVYADLVLAGALRVFRGSVNFDKADILDLVDVTMPAPLVNVPNRRRKLFVHVEVYPSFHKYSGVFRVVSTGADGDETHCTGYLKRTTIEARSTKFLCACPVMDREIRRIVESPSVEKFSTRTIYELLFPQVVAYGGQYRAIKTIAIDSESSTAYAVCQLPLTKFYDVPARPSVINSIFVDSLFHAAGFLVNFTSAMNGRDIFICSQVDKVKVYPDLADPSVRYAIYASAVHMEEDFMAVDVFAMTMGGPSREILACLKRARFRKVVLSSFKKMLSLASGQQFSDPPSTSGPLCPEEESLSSSAEPASLHTKIARIISETSDIPSADISPEAELSKLGINSLMIWEVVARLRALLPSSGRALDVHMFASATTVGDLVRIVSDQRARMSELQADTQRITTLGSSTTLCEVPDSPGLVRTAGVVCCPVEDSKTRGQHDMDSIRISVDPHQGTITSIEVYGSSKQYSGDTAGLKETKSDVIYSIWRLQSSTGDPRVDVPSSPPLGLPEASSCLLETRANAIPLILIHDGTGAIAGYSRLAPLRCDIWAIKNHDFAATHSFLGGDPGSELPTMVEGYLRLITAELVGGEHGIGGECLLGGWSFGGVVAYELARHLLARGSRVKGLVLIDAPAPQRGVFLPDALIGRVVDQTGVPHRMGDQLKTQMKRASQALVDYEPSHSSMAVRNLSAVYLRSREGMDINAFGEMDPRSCAFLTKKGDKWTIPQWEAALGEKVEVLDIPGDHFSAFDEQNVVAVTNEMKEAIRILLSK